jgi:hypothetical protein
LGILSSYVTCRPSYITWIVLPFFSFLCFLVGFDKRVMQVCEDIMGPRSWESFQGPLTRRQARLSMSFSGISLFSLEDCAPSIFFRSWALMAPYLCSRFHIFDRPILEEYVSQVEGGPHLLQSCLRVMWDDLLPRAREMHPFFKSLAVFGALGL